MYRCELCKVVQPARSRSVRVITEARAAEYPSRPKANRLRVGRKNKHFDDQGGAGYEIAREAVACPKCAHTHEAKRVADEAAGTGIYADAAPANGLNLDGLTAD